MKCWRPRLRGTMIVWPRLGSGKTASGLFVEIGTHTRRTDERWEMRDRTRETRMIADVLATYACKRVSPDDVVCFRYGSEHALHDSKGDELTVLSEQHVLAVI